MSSKSSSSAQNLHRGLFPFMSKGHTIPLLHLIKLIHNHRPHATFTVFTTAANQPFISASLSSLPPTTATIISLPFPATNNGGIPVSVESTDQLPSVSLFYAFALSTINLQSHFEIVLENHQKGPECNPISFLICDFFLYWTPESASKFNIPVLSFSGMNMYSSAASLIVLENTPFSGVHSNDEYIQLQEFPWISVSKDDFPSAFFVNDPQDPGVDFGIKCGIGKSNTYATLVNSFVELEHPFVDYINSQLHSHKSWCVGPFCLAEKPTLERPEKPEWIRWLDQKLAQGKPVLYVAFGSQAEISNEQLKEITIGLKKSRAHFVWALRLHPNQEEIWKGFEERVKDKGLVVRYWVEQREILEHKGVTGFMSHCGWNSAIESVCAGVPILAWPMMADQHLNAKLVVEEIEVGLRVETCDGSSKGFVRWEGLSKMVKELMEGDMGIKVKKKVKELSEVAKKCVEEGGSSWSNLETLLNDNQLLWK